MGKYPSYNCRQLERRLREIGCELLRTSGSHRHYSNPYRPDRLITFASHPGTYRAGLLLTSLKTSALRATSSTSENSERIADR